MAQPKRTVFTVLGWVVWKVLAVVGLPMAKKKLNEGRRGNRRLPKH